MGQKCFTNLMGEMRDDDTIKGLTRFSVFAGSLPFPGGSGRCGGCRPHTGFQYLVISSIIHLGVRRYTTPR